MERSVRAVSAVHGRAHHRPLARPPGGACCLLTTQTPFLPAHRAVLGAASKLISGGKIHLLLGFWKD
ncbi:hypothetical protein E2C01_034323 [Portunus trituberculatus]|uniref:Uncharacterized protein n=1 Tax=Portunus trituberculatus TaxID=210409 RepID=A0A5B7F5F6_PORTR|nr:hypothetical protein [Portunus trituberculatus]